MSTGNRFRFWLPVTLCILIGGYLAYISAKHESPLVSELRALATDVSRAGNPYKVPELGHSYREDARAVERFSYECPISNVKAVAEKTFRNWRLLVQTSNRMFWQNPETDPVRYVALVWDKKMTKVFGETTTCFVIVYYRPNWFDKVCGRLGI